MNSMVACTKWTEKELLAAKNAAREALSVATDLVGSLEKVVVTKEGLKTMAWSELPGKCETVESALNRACKHGKAAYEAYRDWGVWKTVTLGIHSNSSTAQKALEEAGVSLCDWDKRMLSLVNFTGERRELDLVALLPEELGITWEKTWHESIKARGLDFGLELCPAEVGPAFQLQHMDQDYERPHYLMMDPIKVHDDSVGHTWGMWHKKSLYSLDSPNYMCFPQSRDKDRFVFVLPRGK